MLQDVKIEVQGKTPLLLNKFTDAAQLAASSGSSSSIRNDSDAPKELAEAALYTDEAGELGIPGPNLFRCLIDAGKFFKAGKSKITTLKTSIIPAAVMLEEPFLYLQSEGGWKVDTRPVRIPATGGRILRHRPCFDNWKLSFSANLDTSIISLSLFRDIVDAAGSRIGLGDFRPDCKGPFGRFVVTSWEVI